MVLQTASVSLPVVHGLGLVVLDQLLFVREYPAIDEKVFAEGHHTQVGGPVPTALAQLARFGVTTKLLGAWANDLTGQRIEEELRRSTITFDASECRSARSSGFAQIWVESSTGRRTVASSPPEGTPSLPASTDFGKAARVLHLDGWGGEAAVAAAEATRSAGGMVFLDAGSIKPATERLLPFVNVLNAPRRFTRQFCQTDDCASAARQLLAAGPRVVTITDGENGAGIYMENVATWLPAFAVRAVDTCGAGDVFCGGLIFSLLNGLEPVDALRFAMATAAIKVTQAGNNAAVPTYDDVVAFLE